MHNSCFAYIAAMGVLSAGMPVFASDNPKQSPATTPHAELQKSDALVNPSQVRVQLVDSEGQINVHIPGNVNIWSEIDTNVTYTPVEEQVCPPNQGAATVSCSSTK